MISTEKLPVPPIRGGAIQTYIANVAPRLAQAGIDLTILGRNDIDLPDEEVRDGVRYVRVEGGMLDTYQQSVTAFLATERFDRIHIFNRPKLVLPLAAAAPESRLSLSLHNEMFLPRKIDPEQAAAAVAAVDRIATVSNFIGQGVSDPYPAAAPKLRTIYSGVDVGQFVPGWTSTGRAMREALRAEHGLSGKQVVLFVGRLSPKKGADILLRAMEIVAKQVPSAALVLVGSKWYGADEMTDFVAYLQNLTSRSPVPVVTTGFITPDQVNQWFAAGDLFVCPSVWQEPLARVHYEAMAAGLPIITTRRGGNPEVVEGAGVGSVVDDPESPEAMAQAILTLLRSSSTRQAMGQAGRALALERYTWDRVAGEIRALWEEGAQEELVLEGEALQQGASTEQAASTSQQASENQPSSAKQKSGSTKKSSSKQKSSSKGKSESGQKTSAKKGSGTKQKSSSKQRSKGRSDSSGSGVAKQGSKRRRDSSDDWVVLQYGLSREQSGPYAEFAVRGQRLTPASNRRTEPPRRIEPKRQLDAPLGRLITASVLARKRASHRPPNA